MLITSDMKANWRREIDPGADPNMTSADAAHLAWQEKELKPQMREDARRARRRPISVVIPGFGGKCQPGKYVWRDGKWVPDRKKREATT